jgi:hypothetical protein
MLACARIRINDVQGARRSVALVGTLLGKGCNGNVNFINEKVGEKDRVIERYSSFSFLTDSFLFLL